MGVGTSIVLIAVGAILRFAVSVSGGFNLHSIGLILMIVGALSLILSLIADSVLAAALRGSVASTATAQTATSKKGAGTAPPDR
jgi:ABC-type amino acid transport system permease subunit